MREKIIELRERGYSYNQIVCELGCAKSTVSYHCGEGQRAKAAKRQRVYNKKILCNKIDQFKSKSEKTSRLRRSAGEFARNKSHTGKASQLFGYQDVIEKFGENTECYLTGERINLYTSEYSFDHIMPRSRGGSNELSNLGITTKKANMAKSDMTHDEFMEFCKAVLVHNGYKIIEG